MTYEQFWYGDPSMVKAYREAYVLKRRIQNENYWLAGLYNYNGFAAIIATAFGKHKEKYIEKPFDIFPKTKEEKKMEERNEKRKLIAFLSSLKNPKNDSEKK